ncbi:DUF2793 domain-containing protein [uncultured Cohaesibacter sp.]|uniref:DUF2793 domain-containing protein n=1 Tax=uncultured Cohaesibacter sp. TaxID=1002546 RepID=UPI002AA8C89E|nr:DUF2793 domain-containing protein [uncultured Cohaesibacter sp.]
MTSTALLQLPYIASNQNQKHITHNEALRMLDALVQLSVLDRDLSAPPDAPADGARYIVADGASGAWTGWDGSVAAYQDGAWIEFVPLAGWLAWLEDESKLLCYDGAGWSDFISTSLGAALAGGSFDKIGVNATADATNRLALSSSASLFNHAGNGHQLKVNKAAAGDTNSLLFQTNWSGRAEMGCAGNDDFSIKVSDGSSWYNGLVVKKDSGAVYLPNHLRLGADSAANELNSYEEGIWTPTLIGLSGGVATLSSDYGVYTKIGALVYLGIHLVTSDVSSLAGQLAIGGLPFLRKSFTGVPNRATALAGFWSGLTIPGTTLNGFMQDTSRIRLMSADASGGDTYVTAANLTGNVTLYMTATYMAE